MSEYQFALIMSMTIIELSFVCLKWAGPLMTKSIYELVLNGKIVTFGFSLIKFFLYINIVLNFNEVC